MTPAVAIDDLSHAFGPTPVLHAVSFHVAAEEFFVVIGPNGSGKTTLLKLMAGLANARSGDIAIEGRPLQHYSRRQLSRITAYVPQMVTAELPFRVREVIMLGRAPHQGLMGWETARDQQSVEAAMQFTGVMHIAERKLSQLSGGELQRVFIARALCQEPRIIFLDEPTSALDLAHQGRLMDLLRRLQTDKQLTVVMVSHDLNAASMYGERLLLLNRGRVERIGSPREVLTEALLEKVYGCRLFVDTAPVTGMPRVVPVPEKFAKPRP
jgi:iron complex transport system ATP-binding protein